MSSYRSRIYLEKGIPDNMAVKLENGPKAATHLLILHLLKL